MRFCSRLFAVFMLLMLFHACAQTESQTKSDIAASRNHPNVTKPKFSVYHAGPWEQQIGYSQAVRAGHTIYISGTLGADEKGFPKDMESQMKLAYSAIRKTMSQYGADFSNVVMERIYTTDMDTLVKGQETRKSIYGTSLPAATWVEVRRLYVPEALIEIEVELVLD